MSIDWRGFIDRIFDKEGKLLKTELKAMITNAKDDPDEFIKKQGEKLEDSICQLASGQLPANDFKNNIIEIRNSTETEALKLSLIGRIRVQGLITGINRHIIDGLLSIDLKPQISSLKKISDEDNKGE